MHLSIAMATYNGEHFLSAQLASLAAQTRPPDELVACDDGSSDGTVEILRAFASDSPFPVRVVVNDRNLGSAKNFEKAIGLCRGDVIALCDQDDRWLPRKLERIARAFADEPGLGMVFSDAAVVDEDLRPRGDRLWQAAGFSRREWRQAAAGGLFGVLLRHNVVTGAAMAFAARHRPLLLPVEPGCVHDEWIALLLSAATPCRMLPEPLIDYRQHGRQQIGSARNTLAWQIRMARQADADYFERERRKYAAALDRLRNRAHLPQDSNALAALEQRIAHTQARIRMCERGPNSLPLILGELLRGRFHRYGYGWKSLAQALFLS